MSNTYAGGGNMMSNEKSIGIEIIKGKSLYSKPPQFLHQDTIAKVREFHKTVEGYELTPLASLPELSKKMGVGGIYVKDESYRFGLNAFKSLGGVYAVAKTLCRELKLESEAMDYNLLTTPQIMDKAKDMVFITATDGNHGKGIAWAAAKFGCKAVIYMPKGSTESRAEAIRKINNTKVVITEYNYDDTVHMADKCAKENGWFLVQDTGWEGYEEIPNWITQGYTTMASEAIEQLESIGISKPTHVFLQAGVGSMAGGVLGYLANYYDGKPPITTIVEPSTVACIYESSKAGDGKPRNIEGIPVTIMAGLNCGAPNTFTWPILRDYAQFYASCPDYVSARGMRILGNPVGNDRRVISGESGAVGLGLLSLLMEREELSNLREQMKLDKNSNILIFSTEGNTDPEAYDAIVYDGMEASPFL